MNLPTIEDQAIALQVVGDPYLKVQITPQQAAVLPMGQAQEAIAIPTGRVTPMPNMPPCVLGVFNHKSRVFWVIDLPYFLGLARQNLNVQQYKIAIIKSGKTPLGLVVPEIHGVVRFATEAIQPPIGEILPGLTSYLHGCLMQGAETLWILDPEAIINSSDLSQ
jgi:positive phototaxis protein PixI